MNEKLIENHPLLDVRLPLNLLLRRRREELSLRQADVAEALNVTPEAVGMWEGGHRRFELAKVPRIAAVLQIDAKQLCVQALAESYPTVHAVLFQAAETANN